MHQGANICTRQSKSDMLAFHRFLCWKHIKGSTRRQLAEDGRLAVWTKLSDKNLKASPSLSRYWFTDCLGERELVIPRHKEILCNECNKMHCFPASKTLRDEAGFVRHMGNTPSAEQQANV